MTPYIFTYRIFNHDFMVYASIDDDLEADMLRDESITLFPADVDILAVYCGPVPAVWDGESGIRECLHDAMLNMMTDEAVMEIENAISIERAANMADKAMADYKESRGH